MGVNIDLLIDEMIQSACDLWHEMMGGEVVWISYSQPKPLDIFERMDIAG